MNKEQQDLAWRCLPRETREKMRKNYPSDESEWEDGYQAALEYFFGHHNLTSDEEPSELLFVERQDIINRYKAILVQQDPKNFGFSDYLQGQKELLESMFAAKCIPDKESSVQDEPKFKVGDKIKVTYGKDKGRIGVITDYSEDNGTCTIIFNGYNYLINFSKEWIEPYTEPKEPECIHPDGDNCKWKNICDRTQCYFDPIETETKDNIEEKELNLCEILRDHKGEEIYILSHGYMTVMGGLVGTVELEGTGEHGEVLNLMLNDDGTHIKGTEVIAFPSRALYEKYPLDAYSAWMEWKSERTAKRWRAEESEFYYRIDTYFEAREETEWHLSSHDNILYEIGNYFRTKEEAEQAAEAVRECLIKFHEQNIKK